MSSPNMNPVIDEQLERKRAELIEVLANLKSLIEKEAEELCDFKDVAGPALPKLRSPFYHVIHDQNEK